MVTGSLYHQLCFLYNQRIIKPEQKLTSYWIPTVAVSYSQSSGSILLSITFMFIISWCGPTQWFWIIIWEPWAMVMSVTWQCINLNITQDLSMPADVTPFALVSRSRNMLSYYCHVMQCRVYCMQCNAVTRWVDGLQQVKITAIVGQLSSDSA